MSDPASPTPVLRHLPVDAIRVAEQVRRSMDRELLESLTASIAEHGVLVPVLVRMEDGVPWMVDGHRRLLAAAAAGVMSIPSLVQGAPLSAAEVMEVQLVTAWQREDLSLIDRGRALRSLMERHGLTAARVAGRVGISEGNVAKYLALLQLPEAIQQEIARGAIGLSAAYQLARISDEARQAELARSVSAGKLTREGVAAALKPKARTPRKRASRGGLSLASGPARLTLARGADPVAVVSWLEDLLVRARKALAPGLKAEGLVAALRREMAHQENPHDVEQVVALPETAA